MPRIIMVAKSGIAAQYNARFANRNIGNETRENTLRVEVFEDVGPPGPPSVALYGKWFSWDMTDLDWSDTLFFISIVGHSVNDPNGADVSWYFASEFSAAEVLLDLTRKDVELLVDKEAI